ncbi:hypothetical protein FF011L_28740 [Roseimaritima multifibrata]|uniref:DinB superfamily protein n=1 Tax=Roseimaritima multifibrata TaxID=1930274 RepID=A0A517MGU9_9BACT|nr:DinB family protein [Roseimaritima multifibrata]QDS94096.1 hypothetical protein FF011L_28740 [Roseimaritima multifibrata]
MLRNVFAALLLYALLSPSTADAKEGAPVAIRTLPNGATAIETMSGLKLQIVQQDSPSEKSGTDFDKTILLSETGQHLLSRQANEPAATWSVPKDTDGRKGILVRSIGTTADPAMIVRVDGLQILIGVPRAVAKLTPQQYPNLDVVVLRVDNEQPPAEDLNKTLSVLVPRFVLVSASNSDDAKKVSLANVPGSSTSHRNHNTFAITSKEAPDESQIQRVVLTEQDWEPSAELEKLFQAMETSAKESQSVFSKLSVDQMNFRPSNGTHTPRWNTEHMMGRQLLFFSQIYHAADPMIPVIDLNPKQMPPDYRAAHPDWDGAEEARQIQRVGDYCRRFSYLLDGMDVDSKAPGSSWPSLRALFVQMEIHYLEHTTNTVKKFDLPDWPKE